MQHGGGLLNGAKRVACLHLVADLGDGLKVPFLFVVERGNVDASFEVGAGDLHNLVERTLNAVVNRADQAGAQLNGQRRTGGFNGFAGAETGGFFIYLNGRAVAVHLDNLANQTLRADAHNVEHIRVAHTLGDNQRTRDLCDNSFFQILHLNR